ncbi:MAG: response regulator [Spartobacteria bacterium]|nr:response regulator [Spartobacteria bacterium]
MNTTANQYAILEQMPVGCFVMREDGTVQFWNRTMEQWTGQSARDMWGQPIYSLFPRLHDRQLTMRLAQVFKQGTPIVLSSQLHALLFPLTQPNGRARVIQTKVAGIQASGCPGYDALFIIQDISDLYENMQKYRDMRDKALAEVEERQRIQQSLEYAKEVAEEANQAKTRFLANMSHEIRTPLNAIIGFSTLLKETPMQQAQQEDLDIIISESRHLLSLIDEVLDVARIEVDELTLDRETFDLRCLLGDIEQSMRLTAREKKLVLSVHVDPSVPNLITGDRRRLHQVIQNLLNNAVKFTPAGSVALSVHLTHDPTGMCAGKAAEGQCPLLFCVEDTGVGLSQEECEHIFDEFYQADSSSTRQFGGVGLGLAIARRLVMLMGGRIWVESERNKGSTFKFTISATQGSVSLQGEAGDIFSVFEAGVSPVCCHLTILLAEDDLTNQRLLNAYLSGAGHTITIVDTGGKVVEEWEKGGYDIILMDVQMPHMDGLEATRIIREREAGKGLGSRIPIIAITAHAMKGDHKRCLLAGMDAYLTKPISRATLEYAIGEVVAKRWVQASGASSHT